MADEVIYKMICVWFPWQKGCGYHLDLFWVGVLMAACSFMGLPWYVAATVISIAHIDSLKMESASSAPGEQPQFLGVRSVGWLVGWLVGWSVGWLVKWNRNKQKTVTWEITPSGCCMQYLTRRETLCQGLCSCDRATLCEIDLMVFCLYLINVQYTENKEWQGFWCLLSPESPSSLLRYLRYEVHCVLFPIAYDKGCNGGWNLLISAVYDWQG